MRHNLEIHMAAALSEFGNRKKFFPHTNGNTRLKRCVHSQSGAISTGINPEPRKTSTCYPGSGRVLVFPPCLASNTCVTIILFPVYSSFLPTHYPAMYNVSTNFFVLLSYEFMPGKGIGWNNPDALCCLGIPCRPSTVRSDPLPPKLNHSTSADIADLIVATTLKSSVDKARKFVEAEKPPKFNKGRAAFVDWYRAYLSHLVNKRMNATMAAAQCTIPELLSLQEDDSYPQTSAFNVNEIGTELIGSVICNGRVVSSSAAPLVKGLLTATLGRIRKHYYKGQNAILGKKVAGGRDLQSSLWIKTETLMTGWFIGNAPELKK